MDAIVVDGLRKRYGDVQALDGVSFRVREGEVFGLLGPNGAGKSTTVARSSSRSPSRTRAAPRSPATTSSATPDAVRRSIGYVPQASGVDRDATGRENLDAPGPRPGHSAARALRERVDELLELFGLADAADRSSAATRAA